MAKIPEGVDMRSYLLGFEDRGENFKEVKQILVDEIDNLTDMLMIVCKRTENIYSPGTCEFGSLPDDIQEWYDKRKNK